MPTEGMVMFSCVSTVWALGSQISVLQCCNVLALGNVYLIIAVFERWIISGKLKKYFPLKLLSASGK